MRWPLWHTGIWRVAPVLFFSGLLLSPLVGAAGLSLDEAVKQALLHNQDLAAARISLDVARGRLLQAGLWPNPRMQLSGDTDAPFANSGEFSASVGLSQEFPIAGRIARQQDLARVDVAQGLAEVNEAERKLAGEVASQFYAQVAQAQEISLRDDLIKLDQSLLEATRNRRKAGEVSQLDVNTVALEVERLSVERDGLLTQQATAATRFGVLLGVSQTPELLMDLPPVEPQPPVDELKSAAFNARADLRLRALEADKARAEQALAKASAWEDWTAGVGIQQSRLSVDGAPGQPVERAVGLSVSIPLPLFNRNQGAEAAARASERQAQESLAALRFAIAQEVTASYQEVSRLADTLRSLQQRSLPLSLSNAQAARDAYRQGQLSIAEVVQTERLANEGRVNYLQSYANYLQALARLKSTIAAWSADETHFVERLDVPANPENH